MPLRIELDHSKCQPGQVMNALVAWAFESTPSNLKIEVSWQTSGKGTEDSETIFTERWTPASQSGEKKIPIPLPRGPISVRGKMISIEWQIECTSKRPDESCTMPFVLSHLDHPAQLTAWQ